MVQERHEEYMKRRMREEEEREVVKHLTRTELLEKDMSELTSAYYEVIKRVQELNDEVNRLRIENANLHNRKY